MLDATKLRELSTATSLTDDDMAALRAEPLLALVTQLKDLLVDPETAPGARSILCASCFADNAHAARPDMTAQAFAVLLEFFSGSGYEVSEEERLIEELQKEQDKAAYDKATQQAAAAKKKKPRPAKTGGDSILSLNIVAFEGLVGTYLKQFAAPSAPSASSPPAMAGAAAVDFATPCAPGSLVVKAVDTALGFCTAAAEAFGGVQNISSGDVRGALFRLLSAVLRETPDVLFFDVFLSTARPKATADADADADAAVAGDEMVHRGSMTPLERTKRLLGAVIQSCDGERDPVCVLHCFRLNAATTKAFSAEHVAYFADDLFELLAVYFPVMFTPPPGCPVSREDLSAALCEALSAPLFHEQALPLCLSKLSSPSALAKGDSLVAISECVALTPFPLLEQHLAEVLSAVRGQVVQLTTQADPGLAPILRAALRVFESVGVVVDTEARRLGLSASAVIEEAEKGGAKAVIAKAFRAATGKAEAPAAAVQQGPIGHIGQPGFVPPPDCPMKKARREQARQETQRNLTDFVLAVLGPVIDPSLATVETNATSARAYASMLHAVSAASPDILLVLLTHAGPALATFLTKPPVDTAVEGAAAILSALLASAERAQTVVEGRVRKTAAAAVAVLEKTQRVLGTAPTTATVASPSDEDALAPASKHQDPTAGCEEVSTPDFATVKATVHAATQELPMLVSPGRPELWSVILENLRTLAQDASAPAFTRCTAIEALSIAAALIAKASRPRGCGGLPCPTAAVPPMLQDAQEAAAAFVWAGDVADVFALLRAESTGGDLVFAQCASKAVANVAMVVPAAVCEHFIAPLSTATTEQKAHVVHAFCSFTGALEDEGSDEAPPTKNRMHPLVVKSLFDVVVAEPSDFAVPSASDNESSGTLGDVKVALCGLLPAQAVTAPLLASLPKQSQSDVALLVAVARSAAAEVLTALLRSATPTDAALTAALVDALLAQPDTATDAALLGDITRAAVAGADAALALITDDVTAPSGGAVAAAASLLFNALCLASAEDVAGNSALLRAIVAPAPAEVLSLLSSSAAATKLAVAKAALAAATSAAGRPCPGHRAMGAALIATAAIAGDSDGFATVLAAPLPTRRFQRNTDAADKAAAVLLPAAVPPQQWAPAFLDVALPAVMAPLPALEQCLATADADAAAPSADASLTAATALLNGTPLTVAAAMADSLVASACSEAAATTGALPPAALFHAALLGEVAHRNMAAALDATMRTLLATDGASSGGCCGGRGATGGCCKEESTAASSSIAAPKAGHATVLLPLLYRVVEAAASSAAADDTLEAEAWRRAATSVSDEAAPAAGLSTAALAALLRLLAQVAQAGADLKEGAPTGGGCGGGGKKGGVAAAVAAWPVRRVAAAARLLLDNERRDVRTAASQCRHYWLLL